MGRAIVRKGADRDFPVLLVQYFVLVILVLTALAYFLFSDRQFSEVAIYALGIALSALTVWSVWSWYRSTRSVFDFYVMFFLAAVLFNGGHALLEVLQLNPEGILDGRFPPETIIQALFMVVVGLAFFHTGALVTARLILGRTHDPHSISDSSVTDYYLRVVGWTLLLVSAVPTVLVLQQALHVSVTEGYYALYQQQAVTGLAGSLDSLAEFLVPGALFLLAGSKGRRWSLAASALVMLSYSVANFVLGSRIEATAPLLAYAWLWHKRIRRLPPALLVMSAVSLLLLIFPFVKATRNLTGGAKLDPATLLETFGSVENPRVAIVSEMGNSLMTVAHTIRLVPVVREFDLGLSYLYGSLTVFPNLFWDIHPTIAHGLASHWLVRTVSPALAEYGGGYGYSFIAEAYLNFGWVGVTLVLALIGALLAAVAVWAQRAEDPSRLALAASFGAFFIVFARAESGAIFRGLVWYALGPYIAVRILMSLAASNRRTSKRNPAPQIPPNIGSSD